MRRLIARLTRDDTGASAILIGLLMIPLLGGLAISVDVGMLYSERAQLQNGADAAALAVGADCADAGGCSQSVSIANQFADLNTVDGSAFAFNPTFPTSTSATVVARTEQADGGIGVRHPFAQFLGFTETTVTAEATVEWGSPRAGYVLPLALSYCEFENADLEVRTLIQYDTNKPCKGPIGQPIAGGFGWLDQLPDRCEAFVDLDDPLVGSDPGNDPPKNCEDLFQTLEGTTVLIPVYDCSYAANKPGDCSNGVNGQKGVYRIWAFAAFYVTGWKFSGNGNGIMHNPDPLAPACTGNCRGIQGYFQEWVEVGGDWELGGPGLAVTVVRLIN
ncbi:pilus assembly protein TadG-related protein [uncultured Schumannella sp.]|uniref:pilus assembly protein TadG-related protein n=1 Tax=uncultured Schumannella sp. TaxID=1195956 RepID=UPI0025F7C4E9|nr:pilus assembly protein TadG-related protein [uncultured Schumannella sp.]